MTETPLDQIQHLTKWIEGRAHNLEPYGFVFRKDLLLKKGAQPAIYINGYGSQNDVHKGYNRIFLSAVRTGFTGEAWRVLPFVNVMRRGCDFAWEREWRVTGDFEFDLADLKCVILPPSGYGPLRYRLDKLGIAVISPTKFTPSQTIRTSGCDAALVSQTAEVLRHEYGEPVWGWVTILRLADDSEQSD